MFLVLFFQFLEGKDQGISLTEDVQASKVCHKYLSKNLFCFPKVLSNTQTLTNVYSMFATYILYILYVWKVSDQGLCCHGTNIWW